MMVAKQQRLVTIQLHTDMKATKAEWLAEDLAEGWRIISVTATGGCTPFGDPDSYTYIPASAWLAIVLERGS